MDFMWVCLSPKTSIKNMAIIMVSPSIDWPIVDKSFEVKIANRVKPAPIVEVMVKQVKRCWLKLTSYNKFMDSKKDTE